MPKNAYVTGSGRMVTPQAAYMALPKVKENMKVLSSMDWYQELLAKRK